jgi:hypothetical protein
MNKVVEKIILDGNNIPIGNQMFRDYGLKPATAYSLRRLYNDAYRAIRVRDDTGTETDIGFNGRDLDTATLQSWLQRNQVASTPLGTDADANGVSDGWSKLGINGGTGNATIEDFTQKLELTGSTQAFSSYNIYKSVDLTLVSGNVLNFKIKYKKTTTLHTTRCGIGVDWYNGASYISTSSILESTDSDEFINIEGSRTAPANATIAKIYIRIQADNAIGATGSAWFKDASVTISNQSAYVTTWYDQSGNGRNATQATADNQPRIVNAGVLETMSGKPTVNYSGNQKLVTSESISSLASISIVANSTAEAGTNLRLISLGTGSTTQLSHYYNIATTLFAIGYRYPEFENIRITLSLIDYLATKIISYTRATTTYQGAWINGVSIGTNVDATTTFTDKLTIGNSDIANTAWIGKLSELIITEPLTDLQRQKLERDQSRYYSVSLE